MLLRLRRLIRSNIIARDEIPRVRGAIAGPCVFPPLNLHCGSMPLSGVMPQCPFFLVVVTAFALCAGVAREMNAGNLMNGVFTQGWGALPAKPHERFAVFPNRRLSVMAMADLIFESPGFRNLTLQQAINKYAPPLENATSRYYAHVIFAVRVVRIMKDYSLSEREIILAAMQKEEG